MNHNGAKKSKLKRRSLRTTSNESHSLHETPCRLLSITRKAECKQNQLLAGERACDSVAGPIDCSLEYIVLIQPFTATSTPYVNTQVPQLPTRKQSFDAKQSYPSFAELQIC